MLKSGSSPNPYRLSGTAARRWTPGAAGAALLLLMVPSALLARQGAPPTSRTQPTLPLSAVARVALPAVDAATLLAEDARAGKATPLRYAVPVEVEITPRSAGTTEPLAAGGTLWRCRFHAPGATDLNFGFTRFELPAGATLHVWSESGDYYQGPYTYLDNKPHGQLWTPVVPGERAVVELYVPGTTKFEPRLELTRVGTGYRDLFGREPRADAKQGACNNDVVCPEGDPWRDQIRSEAVYSTGGSLFCSGQMIIDVPRSFRNFFLTANHCGMSAGNAPSMVVYWNYESPVCGQLSGGSLADNQTGATFRASKTDVDVALVELDDPPDPSSDVFYSGWDRSGNVPQSSVGIHHPNTDEKAISFNDDPLTTVNSCIGSGGSNTHWEVDNWEDGTTEPGSSGSGLWDPATKRLVGFLSGGLASCSTIDYDCYGKFSVAWDSGTTAATRLRDWLDPGDTGTLGVDGSDPSPTVRYVSHLGTDVCIGNPANVNGLWEPRENVTVPVLVRGSGDFTSVQGTLTTSTPGVNVIDGTATWPDLTSGVDATSDAPHFTIRLTYAVACFSEVDFQVEITTAEGGPFTLVFSHPVGAPLTPDVPQPIPDGGGSGSPGISTLEVAQDVTLTDVDVRAEITHTYVGDLALSLRSPVGTEVVLLDRPGVPAGTYGCSDNNMNVTFDDASGFDPESYCPGSDPWYSGFAAPVGSLGDFNGQSSAGTWSLIVSDNAGVDTGSIIDWELVTTPAVSGWCTVCPDVPVELMSFSIE
ncbi:MAG: trypsin-like serine protease [bacterium]|nr:trypsin-like serine protease [bacterium]